MNILRCLVDMFVYLMLKFFRLILRNWGLFLIDDIGFMDFIFFIGGLSVFFGRVKKFCFWFNFIISFLYGI